jgi:hypothetical protein
MVLSKNGAAFGNGSAGAGNAVEIGSGWYYYDYSATDTGSLGPIIFRGTEASIDEAEKSTFVISATTGGITNLDATVSSRLASGSYTAPDNATIATINGNVDVAVSTRLAAGDYTAPDNTTIGEINTKIGEPDTGTVSEDIANVQQAVDDGFSAVNDSFNTVQTAIGNLPSSATISEDVWDFVLDFENLSSDSAGRLLHSLSSQVLAYGRIQTVNSQTSFVLFNDTPVSADDDAYNGCLFLIKANFSSARKCIGVISDYNGSTRTITLANSPGIFTISGDDLFWIVADRSLKSTVDNRTLDVTATGAAGIDLANVENPTTTLNLSGTTIKTATDLDTKLGTPAVSVSADIAAVPEAVNTLEPSGISGTLGFLIENASNQANEIRDDTENIQSTLATNLDATVSSRLASGDYTTPPTVGQIEDAVLDAVATDHNTSGTIGEAINDAAAGGGGSGDVLPKKNTALSNFPFYLVLSSDHVTPATGKTVSAYRSIDGGAFAACTNSPTEISNGFYKIDLSAADMNGDTISLRFSATGADQRPAIILTQP